MLDEMSCQRHESRNSLYLVNCSNWFVYCCRQLWCAVAAFFELLDLFQRVLPRGAVVVDGRHDFVNSRNRSVKFGLRFTLQSQFRLQKNPHISGIAFSEWHSFCHFPAHLVVAMYPLRVRSESYRWMFWHQEVDFVSDEPLWLGDKDLGHNWSLQGLACWSETRLYQVDGNVFERLS